MKEKIIAKFLPLSFLTLCLVLGFQQLEAQGIILDYEEMTDLERDDLLANYSTLGVFYGDQGVAVLDRYTVSNALTTPEKFAYEFVIEAGDDFIIPSGKDAAFKSCNKIVLTPGFSAPGGSYFRAEIDSNCDLNIDYLANGQVADRDASNEVSAFTNTRNFPNPFTSTTNIEFSVERETVLSVEVTSLTGQRIALLRENERFSSGDHQILFDASDLPNGIYLCNLRDENGPTNHIKLVKQ